MLRKAVAYLKLKEFEKALDMAKQAKLLNKDNKEAIKVYQQVEIELRKVETLKLKAEGAQLLRGKKYEEAQKVFQECLKTLILNDKSLVDYLSIMLNLMTCHLQFKRLDEIISLGLRGIKLIKNYENKVIFKTPQGKEFEDKLQKI